MATDVVVAAETTNDIDPFIKGLQASQAALDNFAQYANSLKIAPVLQVDQTTVITGFRATLAQMVAEAQTAGSAINLALASQLTAVPVTLNMTVAQSQLQTLINTVQNITLTFNAPSAMQIGTDIGNAAAQAFQAAVNGMTFPGGGGGSSGGGGSGGGSSGGGRGRMGGFGRILMPLFVAHQAIHNFEIWDQYNDAINAAGGSRSGELEADIRRKKEQDGLLMGLGRVGRLIGENIPGASMTMEDERIELAQREYANSSNMQRRQTDSLTFETRMKTEHAALTGLDPHVAAEKLKKDLAEIELTRKTQVNSINTARNNAEDDAVSKARIHKKAIAEEFEKTKPILFDATDDNPAYRKWKSDKAAALAEVDEDRAYIFSKGTSKKFTAQEQAANLTAENAKKAAQEEYDRQEGIRDQESNRTVQRSQLSATAMNLRLQGDDRAAKNLEFKAQAHAPVQALQDKLKNERDPAEKERLQEQYNAAVAFENASVANHFKEQKKEDAYEKRKSEIRAEDITASGHEALQKANGDVTGANRSEFVRKLDQNIANLTLALEKAGGAATPEGKNINRELQATKGERGDRLGAFDTQEATRLNREVADMHAKTMADMLEIDGNYYGASLEKLRHYYDEKLKLIANDPAKHQEFVETQKEKATAEAKIQKKMQDKTDDINEHAKETELKTRHMDKTAEAEHLKYETEKRLKEVTGTDAQSLKQRQAILRDAEASANSLIEGGRKAEEINPRQLWFDMQKKVLEGGDDAGALKNLQNAAKGWHLQGAQAAQDLKKAEVEEANKKAAEQMQNAGDAIGKAAKDISDVMGNLGVV